MNTTQISRPFPVNTLIVVLAALAAIACIPGWARAQGDPGGWPRFVVPSADGVLMRCGQGVAWYPIRTLKRTDVLRAEGEQFGWLSVSYLPDMTAVVRTDEVEFNEREGRVKLTRRSRLRALSQADPVFDESFRPVFEEFLAPGVEMRYIGPIRNRAGELAGYIVVPPEGARGFVLASEVRAARPEEVERFGSAPAAVAAPAVAPPVERPAEGAPAGAESAAAPASAAEPAPAPAEPEPAVAPPVRVEPAPAPEPPAPKGPSIRQLDRAFDELMKKPLGEADPQELIEQYERYADGLEGTPGSERTLRYVDSRVQLLRLRARARDLLPEIQALEDAARNAEANYRLTVDRLIENREYLAVGRLFPSTVYDGTRLPLMYRLVSVNPAMKSTLAYVIPVPEHQLEQKIGAIVGILGDGRSEPASLVQIITPTQVDVLRATEAPAPEPVR